MTSKVAWQCNAEVTWTWTRDAVIANRLPVVSHTHAQWQNNSNNYNNNSNESHDGVYGGVVRAKPLLAQPIYSMTVEQRQVTTDLQSKPISSRILVR